MYRAFAARREVVVIRANRDEFKRRRLEEARATVVIQSGIRGRAARRVAAAKRAAIVDAARRETGLLIIQVRIDIKHRGIYCCEGLSSIGGRTSQLVNGVSRYGTCRSSHDALTSDLFFATWKGSEGGPIYQKKIHDKAAGAASTDASERILSPPRAIAS